MRTHLFAHTLCASVLTAGVGTFGWAEEAQAVVVNVSGIDYDVTTFYGTYTGSTGLFTTAQMPWFGSQGLANQFAQAVGTQLGTPNFNLFSPFYAYQAVSNSVTGSWLNSGGLNQGGAGFTDSRTYAIATALPSGSASSVPGPLPLFGAAAAFGWSRRLRLRITVTQSDHQS